MNKKVTLAQLQEVVQEAYDQVKTNTGGKNADYIPYLANVNKDLFGISVCLLNGQTIHVGDTDYRFGIESVSKVHTAILALRQYGAKEILDKIGADATGLPFNSIIAILLENDHPSTPLVNAGAISACSMVKPIGDSAKKWDAIVGNITDLCGSAPQLIDELYKSESDTNFNNRSIAWLLKNYNRIYDDPDMSLDLYTRQCSLGVTALQLSIAAGTIANGGVAEMQKRAKEKADMLYAEIDRNKMFRGTVTDKADRSYMNICFVMNDEYKDLEADFLKFATEKGMVGIKGHRSVGGFRASCYNAMPKESVQALIDCMQEFEKLH